MHRWTIHRLQHGLGDHAAEWDALNTRLFNAHPMLDSRFVDGLLKHFGNGTEHLCIQASNGVPQAMCLLQPKRLGIWATFLPSQAQIGLVLRPNADALHDLIRSLPGTVARLDFLCNDPEFGDLSNIDHTTSTSTNHVLTMNISLDDGFAHYWAARSKNLAKNIDRYERRLATDNIARKFLCISAPDSINPAVARYAALESKGWKAKLGTALEVNNSQGLFYAELMTRLASTGNAMVFELWFDDHLAASRLVIASANMVSILKTTYDETHDRYAPWRLLLHDIIQSLFTTHPGKVIEFYTDANADNLAWATGHRWIQHVSFYRSALTKNAFKLLHAGRQVLTSGHKPPTAADATLSVSVYRHPDEFPLDVQHLFEQAEKENVEFGAAWYRNLVNKVFANHEGVHIYVLRKNGHPAAALPVLAHKTTRGQSVASLSNYYTSVYALLMEPGLKAHDLVPLINTVKATHAPLSTLRFAPMDPASPGYRTLQEALQTSGLETFKFFCFGNWHLRVDGDLADYLKTRSGTLRSTIKRMTKKFAADGGTLELLVDSTHLARGLDAFQQVYRAKWKKEEPFPQFIPGLVQTCAERGWLRLGVAWHNGQPIAAQLWIVANGKANIYKVAYNEDFKPYAPGTLLTALLMAHVIEQDRVTEVDFLIGDDPYKKTWMSHRRERWGIIAYNPKTLGGLLGLGKEVLGRTLMPLVARTRSLVARNTKQT
jgi:CelD/BcsL family acetyltransferase involved in cellulose biosynthesis